jgi:anti-sigma factor RsiW
VTTPPPNAVSDHDLNAFVDGQLAPEQVSIVEAALARNPELAARVADFRAQGRSLRDALDPVLDETIPDRLLAAARQPEGRARREASGAGLDPRWPPRRCSCSASALDGMAATC